MKANTKVFYQKYSIASGKKREFGLKQKNYGDKVYRNIKENITFELAL